MTYVQHALYLDLLSFIRIIVSLRSPRDIMRIYSGLLALVLASLHVYHVTARALGGKPSDFIIAEKRAPLQDIVSVAEAGSESGLI